MSISQQTKTAINNLNTFSEKSQDKRSWLLTFLALAPPCYSLLAQNDPLWGLTYTSIGFVGALYCNYFTGSIGYFGVSLICNFLQKIRDPQYANISLMEISHLLENYIRFQNLFEEDASPENFIRYLKLRLKREELLTLIKMGATPSDVIETFEHVDASQVISLPIENIHSLQWLAARKINQLNKQNNNNLPIDTLTNNAQKIVSVNRKYVI